MAELAELGCHGARHRPQWRTGPCGGALS